MRKAFSLIELVFAIVIVGVASTAIPTIVMQGVKLDSDSLTRNDLLSSAKTMALLIGQTPWDLPATSSDYKGGSRDRDAQILSVYGSPGGASACSDVTAAKKDLCKRGYLSQKATPKNSFTELASTDERNRDMTTYDGFKTSIEDVVVRDDSGNEIDADMFSPVNVNVVVSYVNDIPDDNSFQKDVITFTLTDSSLALKSSEISNIKLIEITSCERGDKKVDDCDPKDENLLTLRFFASNIGQINRVKPHEGRAW